MQKTKFVNAENQIYNARKNARAQNNFVKTFGALNIVFATM